MAQSTLISLVEAMINLAQERAAAGQVSDGIKRLTTMIGVIEEGDRKMQTAYGPQMTRLYGLRAKLFFEDSGQGRKEAQLKGAQQDIGKADAALDAFYGGMDPTQKEEAHVRIHELINPEKKTREAAFAAVFQIGKSIQPSSSGSIPAHTAGDSSYPQPNPMFTGKWGSKVPAFAIGAVGWGIALGICFSGRTPFLLVGMVLVFVLWVLCMFGWDTFPVGGGGGTQLKMFATWIIMATMIGMIPIAYWTGKCILRWRNKLLGNA